MVAFVQVLSLTDQLAAINAQIASGVERGSFNGQSVDFRSLQDLFKIRDSLIAQIGSGEQPVRRTVAAYNGGF